MYTRAMLIGDDLVEVPDASHAAFVERTGQDGLRLRLHADRVAVNLSALITPEIFPAVFPDPARDRETLMEQAETWLGKCPALRTRYPDGCRIDWYL